MNNSVQDQNDFRQVMQVLKAEIANIGTYLVWDAQTRQLYALEIQKMSLDLEGKVKTGIMSWKKAAIQAQETRNIIMEILRSKSTAFGKAMAAQIKQQGKTLNTLIAQKTQKLYGNGTLFNQLSIQQQNNVYQQIVLSAGTANPKVTSLMRQFSYAGRSLIFLSLGASVYNIATADDKWNAAGREVVVTGAGIAGGIGGGAAAGLACGPGAPVCVAIGALLGGALAAFGMDAIW